MDAKQVIPQAAQLLQAGQAAAAKDILAALIHKRPHLWDARHLLGISLFALGDVKEASTHMEQVVRQMPERSDVWVNYVAGLSRFPGEGPRLLAVANQALLRFPRLPSIWLAVASHYEREGQLNMACQVLEQANQKINSNSVLQLAWAKLLFRSNQLERSQMLLEALSASGKQSPESLFLLGRVHSLLGKLEKACHCWSQVLQIQPEHDQALENLMVARRRCCDWSDFDELALEVRRRSERNLRESAAALESPLVCLSVFADTQYNFRVASAATASICPPREEMSSMDSPQARDQQSPIRIGYLSDELRDHPIGHLMHDYFPCHNRDQFDVTIYNHHPASEPDAVARSIFAAAQRTRHVSQLNPDQLAGQIRRDQIDILVDLKGWRPGHRLAALAWRPARVQVSFLGFPGTTGAPFMDYILTDDYVLPSAETAYFSENPAYLNRCYFLVSGAGKTPASLLTAAGSREDHALPADALVLTSFNQAYKLDPQTMRIWMELLQKDPSAILWLLELNTESRHNLCQFAVQYGIDPQRLVFAPWADQQRHLARLTHADLYLDTMVYSGHTTTADALRCGVPVVCMAGSHYASRVSASLMRQVGLEDYVASDLDGYRSLAKRLMNDTDERLRLRSLLSKSDLSSRLLDTAEFVRQTEDLFLQMIERYDRGLSPHTIFSRVGV